MKIKIVTRRLGALIVFCGGMQGSQSIEAKQGLGGGQKNRWRLSSSAQVKEDQLLARTTKSPAIVTTALVDAGSKKRVAHKKTLSSVKKRALIDYLVKELDLVKQESQTYFDAQKYELAKEKIAHEQTQKKGAEKDAIIAELIATKDELHAKISKAEQENVALQDQIKDVNQKVASLELYRTQYEQYAQELQMSNGRLEQQLASLKRELEDKKESQVVARLSQERYENERTLQSQLETVQQELRAARLELHGLKHRNEPADNQNHELAQLKEELHALKKEIKAHEDKQFRWEKTA